MQPHRRQPTRLPRPWDSPGKNTGVGCHFLLQCIRVKSESEVAQSCPTPSDPMDCSLPGSSAHGIFQARVLEWGAIAFSDQTSKEELIAILHKLFQKSNRDRNAFFLTHSMKPVWLIPRPNKDTTRKENYKPIFYEYFKIFYKYFCIFRKTDANILKKILTYQIYIKFYIKFDLFI